jgi:hypothetical protein
MQFPLAQDRLLLFGRLLALWLTAQPPQIVSDLWKALGLDALQVGSLPGQECDLEALANGARLSFALHLGRREQPEAVRIAACFDPLG